MGVAFRDRDIRNDRSAREELIEKYGRLATPTIVIRGKLFLGFKENRREIERMVDELAKRAD